MAKKVIVVFFLLIVAYSLLLYFVRGKQLDLRVQSQMQDNMIKAQQFAFGANPCKGVVLGSSLSARIIFDSIPDFCNLSLGGCGVFDGFHILSRKENLPPVVLIETNTIMRLENDTFRAFDNPFFFYLRKYVPVLRDENQPIIKVQAIMRLFLKKNKKKTEISSTSVEESVLQKLLADAKIKNATFDKVRLDDAMNSLHFLVNTIERRGARVIFFEMPSHPELMNSPLAVAIRKSFRKTFPNHIYINPPNMLFHTSDGTHLSGMEASLYTAYIKKHLTGLLN